VNTTRDAALALNEKEGDRIMSEGKLVPSLESLIAEKWPGGGPSCLNCLKGLFPFAEPSISKDADWSYQYAV
jgi:hypothetical protein